MKVKFVGVRSVKIIFSQNSKYVTIYSYYGFILLLFFFKKFLIYNFFFIIISLRVQIVLELAIPIGTFQNAGDF